MRKKLTNILLLLLFIIMLAVPTYAADESIDVFYTNDIHSYINNHAEDENALTYSKIAALKASSKNAVLVDAGDHVQGTAYGGMDSGATILDLMNAAGYDAATLGNHEFDYGMERCLTLLDEADFPYASCNFRHERNGRLTDTVLDSFVILETAGKRIAFVGITTPETHPSIQNRTATLAAESLISLCRLVLYPAGLIEISLARTPSAILNIEY